MLLETPVFIGTRCLLPKRTSFYQEYGLGLVSTKIYNLSVSAFASRDQDVILPKFCKLH